MIKNIYMNEIKISENIFLRDRISVDKRTIIFRNWHNFRLHFSITRRIYSTGIQNYFPKGRYCNLQFIKVKNLYKIEICNS